MNFKFLKKKAISFLISKYFFVLLLLSGSLYLVSVGYSFLRNSDNSKAFSSLYVFLERYQGAVNSNSNVPLEELLKDIEEEEQKLGFFCSIKKQFLLLKVSILLQIKKIDEALAILEKVVIKDSSYEVDYLYNLLIAFTYAMAEDINKKQHGIALLKKYANQKKFQDVAIFYYGYFLLKTTSLEQADQVWFPLKHNPQFNNSPYRLLVEQARNCDY